MFVNLMGLPRGGNKCFITFFYDCSRYTYVYLIWSKDEAFDQFNVINPWLKIKGIGQSKYFVVIEVVNIFLLNLLYTAKKTTLYIYLMNNHSELTQIYRTFAQMISTQFSKVIKVFHTDNAMEYRDSQFIDFIHTQGTIIPRSCIGASRQNGKAKRKHCHIFVFVRAFLISASCPERFLGEAALIAVYSINRLPSSTFQNILLFASLVMHALFYFSCMNIPN